MTQHGTHGHLYPWVSGGRCCSLLRWPCDVMQLQPWKRQTMQYAADDQGKDTGQIVGQKRTIAVLYMQPIRREMPWAKTKRPCLENKAQKACCC